MTQEFRHRKVILASSSPRRKDLLDRLQIEYEILKPDVDESILPDETPEWFVERIAREKARWGLARCEGVVIAADTIVVFNNEILCKPDNAAHAEMMLSKLSDQTHVVYTGLCIASNDEFENLEKTRHVKTKVTFRRLSTKDIQEYVATGEPLDKAGSYGAQGKGAKMIKKLSGSLTNVIGLPLNEVKEILMRDFYIKVF